MLANIIRNRKKTGIGGGGGGIVIDNGDPFYSAVSLLLPMDGTNGSTTFTDSGPNAISVTAVGNAQVSTTQSKYGGASGYFDGTGDYLSISDATRFNFGSGDFTVEFWFYNSNLADQNKCLISLNDNNNLFSGVRVYYNSTNSLDTLISSTGSAWSVIANSAASNSVTKNSWNHYAVVRSGSTLKTFLNGTQYMTDKAISGAVFASSTHLIASVRSGSTADWFQGYIDDLRISRFARYTSTFTPPTAALPTTASSTPADPYYGYTSLLLHMDGTNASTNFVDSGPNALAVTSVGNAQISTTQSKFGGASGYYDGSTGYLSLTGNSSFQFGTGDFTVEAWVYISANASSQQTFLDTRGTATATPFTFGLYQSKLAFYDGTMRQSSATITTGQWYHFAACRSGGTLRLFIDGTSYYSASSSTNFTTGANSIYIGRGFDAAAYYTNGYIDDLRITKYARYTSAFAPPAQAHLEYANGNDRHFSNVSLLLHMDGANGSTTFTDNSSNALAVTAAGTPTISTSQSVFGSSSALFPTNQSYLTAPSSSAWAFGTGDFTIEFWIYITSNQNSQGIIGNRPNSAVASTWQILFWTTNNRIEFHSGAAVVLQSTSTIPLNTWSHVAFCRASGTLRAFLNGVQVGSVANANDYSTVAALNINRDLNVYASNNGITGNLDDVRITKGVARYTSNFTPSTSAFPNA